MSDYTVALISNEFPPFMIGGIASNCYDLAYSLSQKKISTTVFCGGPNTKSEYQINDYLKVVRLPYLNVPPNCLYFQLQNFKVLSKELNKFSVVHTVNPLLSFIGTYSQRTLRKPFITSIHECMFNDMRTFVNSPISEWTLGDFGGAVLSYPFIEYLINKSIKNADHVIVHGYSTFNDMKINYRNLDIKKISIIHNGINFEKFNFIENNITQNRLSIIFHGRLVSRKGILYLIKSISMLTKEFPDLTLNIFGRGPLENKIKSLISQYDLKNNVYLRGFVPYNDLLRYIKEAEIVALPSLYEVGPFISALEAMAFKKPLVVFDINFNREFIFDMYNGSIARAEDVNSLSEKIRLLLLDKELRIKIGQNAYKYAKKKHNWKILVNKYIKIYENHISN
ncbi:MAG: glycosyltransferase family 4 protein [Promethearchaeota archaeon]|jgi:glycosyltransferase involved in cell wall biosynthesis